MNAREPSKRPYTTVGAREEAGLFRLLLDGHVARTPLRHPLETRSRALALALVAEWEAQGSKVDPKTMPMTRLLATKIDRVAPAREAVIAELMRHLDGDAICYVAEGPASLRARQATLWQPIVDWLRDARGISLAASVGVMPHTQMGAAHAAMKDAVCALDDDRLTVFQAVAAATHSLALALAMVHGRLSAANTFAAAFVDGTFQIEQWGDDPEARSRHEAIARDIAAAEDYLQRATAV